MIELITGKPRSGKSYLAVHLLLNEFFIKNKETGYYEPKPDKKDITLITNIEGLKLPHIPLSEAIEASHLPVQKFFTKNYQEKIAKKYPNIIYALDEFQQYFPDTFRDTDTRFYFEWHGHLGHHIYLISQDTYRCCRAIVDLAEIETRAVKRTLSLAGELKYNVMSDKEIIDRKIIRPKKEIYDLYKSQHQIEHKKPKKLFVKYIAVPIALLFVTGYILKKRFDYITTPAHATEMSEEMMKSDGSYKPTSTQIPDVIISKNVWITLRGVIRINDRVAYVIHPFTGELVKPKQVGYDLRLSGRDIQALLPQSSTQQNDSTTSSPTVPPYAGGSGSGRRYSPDGMPM